MGEKKYTEHFTHVNNQKDIIKTCSYTSENGMSEWHKNCLHSNNFDNQEIQKINSLSKQTHFVDVFDSLTKWGLEFQHSSISPESIISRDETTNVDWIFDVTKQFTLYMGKYWIL